MSPGGWVMGGADGGARADGAADRALLDELDDLRRDRRAVRRRWAWRALLLAVLFLFFVLLLAMISDGVARGTNEGGVWLPAALLAVVGVLAGRGLAVVADGLAAQRAARVAVQRRRRDRTLRAAGGDASPARVERALLDDLDDARGLRRSIRRQAVGFSALAVVGAAGALALGVPDATWTPDRARLFATALGAAVVGLIGYLAGVAGRGAPAQANLVRAQRRHREHALYDAEPDALPDAPVRPVPLVAQRVGAWWVVVAAAVLASLAVPAPPVDPIAPIEQGGPVVPALPAVSTGAGAVAMQRVPLDHGAGVAVSPDGRRAYVANHGPWDRPADLVSAVDLSTEEVVGTVRVGPGPLMLAVSPDGSRLYVTDTGSPAARGRSVSVVDTASLTRVATVAVPTAPQDVAVGPDGRVWVVVDDEEADDTPGALVLIDPVTQTVAATIPVGRAPTALAVTGPRVYVADYADNSVSVVDTATRRVETTIAAGSGPLDLAFDPARAVLWVAARNSPDPRRPLTAIDTRTGATATVDLGPVPDGVEAVSSLVLTADGSRLLVGRSVPGPDPRPSLVVVDPATRAVVGSLSLTGAYDLAASSDGRRVYGVAGWLWRIDAP